MIPAMRACCENLSHPGRFATTETGLSDLLISATAQQREKTAQNQE